MAWVRLQACRWCGFASGESTLANVGEPREQLTRRPFTPGQQLTSDLVRSEQPRPIQNRYLVRNDRAYASSL